MKLLKIAFFMICLLYVGRIGSQINFAVSGNYIYSMKWHRDAFFAYYTDVPNNHSASIQGEGLLKICRLLSQKDKSWDNIQIGINSELLYLPYSGMHYDTFELFGTINGIDQYIHFYDHDRYRLLYYIPGIKIKYEHTKIGFITYTFSYPVQLLSRAQTQQIRLNNITGEFSKLDWTQRSTERVRNPKFITELALGMKMSSNVFFTMGFQWTFRSAINLVNSQHHVDNRERAFRNIKLGLQIAL